VHSLEEEEPMPSLRSSLASILLVATVGCGGDSTEPEVTACSAETGSVTATVNVTGVPVFAWNPDCAVTGLLVEHAVGGAGGDVWFIQASPTEANLISPPVTYGTTSLPAGVVTSYGPDPLVAGTSYDLILFRVVDPAITTCPDLFGNTCRLVIHQFTR
jgi:hypothetical protein